MTVFGARAGNSSGLMLPISLRTHGRRALLAGGGNVALRKAESLLAAGLHVHVVAPSIDPRIEALLGDAGSLSRRPYRTGDLDNAFLAVAATNDATVNARIVAEARAESSSPQ